MGNETSSVVDTVTDAGNTIVEEANDGLNTIAEGVNDGMATAIEPTQVVVEQVDNFVSGTAEGLEQLMDAPSETIGSMFDSAESGATKIASGGADLVNAVTQPVISVLPDSMVTNHIDDTVDIGFSIGGGVADAALIMGEGATQSAAAITLDEVSNATNQAIISLNSTSEEIENAQNTLNTIQNPNGTSNWGTANNSQVTIGSTGETFPLPNIQNQIIDNKRKAAQELAKSVKKTKKATQSFINS